MKSKKVLIVDDNDMNRKLFEILIGQFYSFKSAINGLEAIEYLTAESFDLILMDIQMPKMDGISALKRIQHGELTESPVIAVSAYAQEADRENFLAIGFADFIIKPIRSKDFLERILYHLEGKAVKEIETDPISFPPVLLDKTVISQLLKYNSQEIITGIIRDFIQETTRLITLMEQSFLQQNETELQESLHTLKGNSGTLGANSLYLLATEISKMAKSKDWDLVQNAIDRLTQEKLIFETFITEEFTFDL